MSRFRVGFWMLVCAGTLPVLLSGLVLLGHFRLETLCAAERPSVTLSELRTAVMWMRVHQWGRWGALVAGLLVVSYGVASAFERRRHRALLSILCAGLLLPSLVLVLWSGRAVPWRALEPPVATGAGQTLSAPPEWGGPRFCQEHADELRRLRIVYFLHLGSGALALLLTLLLADFGARWRATSASSE